MSIKRVFQVVRHTCRLTLPTDGETDDGNVLGLWESGCGQWLFEGKTWTCLIEKYFTILYILHLVLTPVIEGLNSACSQAPESLIMVLIT